MKRINNSQSLEEKEKAFFESGKYLENIVVKLGLKIFSLKASSVIDNLTSFESIGGMKLIFVLLLFSQQVFASLIAHRGLHQTYHRDMLTNSTCTAKRINSPSHQYLENTLESIEKAFDLGADVVELDVHPTTETSGRNRLVVFHDWTLDCRTDAQCNKGCQCGDQKYCVTHKQSLEYLKSLDIGHGYTSDGGKTFPFRGRFVGRVPSFEEVLGLLLKYPDRKILVNVKGNTDRTAETFMRIVKSKPLQLRSRILYPFKYGFEQELTDLGVQSGIDQSNKKCLMKYVLKGWYGHFPKECRNKKIFIPIRESLEKILGKPGRYLKATSLIWGWPEGFIKKAHKYGTKVYASQVDSAEELEFVKQFEFDGIMTNKIEVIAPLYTK